MTTTSTSTNPVVEVTIQDGRATIDGRPVRRPPRGTVEDAALRQCAALAIARNVDAVTVHTDDQWLKVFGNGTWEQTGPVIDEPDEPAPPRMHTGTAHGPIILAADIPDPEPDQDEDDAHPFYAAGEAEELNKEADRFNAAQAPGVDPDVLAREAIDRIMAAGRAATPVPDPVVPTPDLGDPVHRRPTVDELIGETTPRQLPAQEGWRSLFGLPPGRAELERRSDVATIKSLPAGTWTIVVVNPKGGVGKTTGSRQIAATFARNLVGPTLVWDNNPSRGNLGSRVQQRPVKTVLDLILDLPRLQAGQPRMSDLAEYARLQPEGFYALASARRLAGREAITADQFRSVHAGVSRFCRVVVIDTGNDETSAAWQAAVAAADQLVIVSEAAQDSAEAAAEMMTDLRDSAGDRLVDEAISVVSERASTGGRARRQFVNRMHVFLAEHTRAVLDAPFDHALDGGGAIRQEDLSGATVRAWERVAAAAVAGFHEQHDHRVRLAAELGDL